MDAIWTHHAKDRLLARKMSESDVLETLNNPNSTNLTDKGSTQYKKRIGEQTITVLVKKNDQGENIILSCWVDPPNPGTPDARHKKRYLEKQKAGTFKKFWLTFLDQIGL